MPHYHSREYVLKEIDKGTGFDYSCANPKASIFNNKDVRNVVCKMYKDGRTYDYIAKFLRKRGYTKISEASIKQFFSNYFMLMSKNEINTISTSIFQNSVKLYENMDSIITRLNNKIDTLDGDEEKLRDFLNAVNILKDYHVIAMKHLGELKDNVQRVDKQYIQNNVIVASNQIDYLRELVKDGKIEIKDKILLNMVNPDAATETPIDVTPINGAVIDNETGNLKRDG